MQILLANAKIMYEQAARTPLSTPLFQTVANRLAAEMAQLDANELARPLDCSPNLLQRTGGATNSFMRLSRCLPCLPITARPTSICEPPR